MSNPSPPPPSEAREHAYQDWWAEYSRQWDPNRRLNKSRDAFVAGWNARATFLEAAGQVTEEMLARAEGAYDALAGYSRIERLRAALEAALVPGDKK